MHASCTCDVSQTVEFQYRTTVLDKEGEEEEEEVEEEEDTTL